MPPQVPSNIRTLKPYVPGDQPTQKRLIKLNSNENPYPPSEQAMRALRSLEPELLRTYPDPLAGAFRTAAADLYGLKPENVVCTNGSDELLALAARTFAAPGDVLATCVPTFAMYPVIAQIYGLKYHAVPWPEDWSLPVEALLKARPKLIFVPNPGAPTTQFTPVEVLDDLAKRFDGLLLIDEAYVEFADDHCLRLLESHDNVLITRTVSKAYSLAGLRFGYGLGQTGVIDELLKVKEIYNVDAAAQAVATAALLDQEWAQRVWQQVKQERQRMQDELRAVGFVMPDSQANFLWASVPGGDGRGMFEHLREQGILVRYFDHADTADKLRITVGTPQENNALLAAVKQMFAETAS
ncbi:MAG: histidinol-phosphate transaminase [Phycisphaerae bacterium]